VKFLDAMTNALTGSRPAVPYNPRSSSPVLLSGYGGARATLLGAMGSNGTLYATVSRFSNATSQATWRLWRKSRSGLPEDRVEITSHLALDTWRMPNAYMPQQLFVETFQQHLELVGEGWWVIRRNELGWPESMWVVRPDKIAPVPGGEFGITGYLYYGPNGEQIPLPTEDVIRLKMPDPRDPGPAGRGLGVAQTILSQVEAANFSAQWNRNFFANSAVPGGIITVPDTLGDTAFERLRMQWAEQHRGVSAAHRVGILEGGASFAASSTHRDMEFSELLDSSRDVIREAYAMPKFMLGLVDDVNRANAEASDAAFGTWGLVPRLERIKQALNTSFLPLFGPFGRGTGQPDVEFDYDNPVPPDADSERADVTTKVNAYVALVKQGVDPAAACKYLGLPDLPVTKSPALERDLNEEVPVDA
jgi:HK97 family phage portal protein